MDMACFHISEAQAHLIKSKEDLEDEIIFPPKFNILAQTEANAAHDSDENNDNNEEDKDNDENLSSESDEDDAHEVDNKWGTLVSDKTSKGIFEPMLEATANQTPKINHDFTTTVWACSAHPDIVHDVKDCLNDQHCLEVEAHVRQLLSHDVDGQVDREIDQKVDSFWDELKHFQNW